MNSSSASTAGATAMPHSDPTLVGVLTGRGADIIIIDDPLKPEGRPLTNPAPDGQRLVRPHPLQATKRHSDGCDHPDNAPAAREPALGRSPRDDLAGHVLAQGIGKACASRQSPRTTRFGRSTLSCADRCLPGSAVRHCTRNTSIRYAARSANNPPALRPGGRRQYPAGPRRRRAAAWSTPCVEERRAQEQPDKFDHIVQSWDTANKASVTSDFSVCTSCGIKRRDPLPVTRAALPALRPWAGFALPLPPLPPGVRCTETRWRQRCSRWRQLLVDGICLSS